MKNLLGSIFTNSTMLWKVITSLVFVLSGIIIITKIIQSQVSEHFEHELSQQQSLYLEKILERTKLDLNDLTSRWLEGGTYKLLENNSFNKKSWSGRLLGLADATKNDFGSLFFLTHDKNGKLMHRYNTRETDEFFDHTNKTYQSLIHSSINTELNKTKFIVLESGQILSIHVFPITDDEFNLTNIFTIITDLKSTLKKFKSITNLNISLSNKSYSISTKSQKKKSRFNSNFYELRVLHIKEISTLEGNPQFITEVDKRDLIKSLSGVTNKIFLTFSFVSIIFIFLYFRTVKKLKHQEAKSYEASRLSSLGEMAGGIAHEINNPLTVIQGYAFKFKLLAKKGELPPEKIIEFSDSILEVIQRITNIINSLRNLSRNDENAEFKNATTDEIVSDAIYLSEEKFRLQDVDFKYANDIKEIEIKCRRVELSRVLINLLNNALDAVSSSKLNPEKEVKIDVAKKDGFVVFKVTDNGDGIPKEIQNKIMEPFYTTKAVNVGTGLGLSLSLQVAKTHSGSLDLYSRPGKTVFTLKIPSP